MTRASVPAEIAHGTLSADAAALVWLLLDAGLPLNVTGPAAARPAEIRAACLALSGVSEVDGGTHDAASLEELLKRPGADNHLADESRSLGVVLVIRPWAADGRRVAAVHYVRPVERDGHGHLQRRPPAVLYAWDEARDTFDDFAWGVVPELALISRMDATRFESDHAQRATLLAGLASAGIHAPPEVERAVRGFRLLGAAGDHERH